MDEFFERLMLDLTQSRPGHHDHDIAIPISVLRRAVDDFFGDGGADSARAARMNCAWDDPKKLSCVAADKSESSCSAAVISGRSPSSASGGMAFDASASGSASSPGTARPFVLPGKSLASTFGRDDYEDDYGAFRLGLPTHQSARLASPVGTQHSDKRFEVEAKKENPPQPSVVDVDAAAAPVDLEFGSILQRWRRRFADLQSMAGGEDALSVTVGISKLLPSGASGSATRGGNVQSSVSEAARIEPEDDCEEVLNRIKHDLGLDVLDGVCDGVHDALGSVHAPTVAPKTLGAGLGGEPSHGVPAASVIPPLPSLRGTSNVPRGSRHALDPVENALMTGITGVQASSASSCSSRPSVLPSSAATGSCLHGAGDAGGVGAHAAGGDHEDLLSKVHDLEAQVRKLASGLDPAAASAEGATSNARRLAATGGGGGGVGGSAGDAAAVVARQASHEQSAAVGPLDNRSIADAADPALKSPLSLNVSANFADQHVWPSDRPPLVIAPSSPKLSRMRLLEEPHLPFTAPTSESSGVIGGFVDQVRLSDQRGLSSSLALSALSCSLNSVFGVGDATLPPAPSPEAVPMSVFQKKPCQPSLCFTDVASGRRYSASSGINSPVPEPLAEPPVDVAIIQYASKFVETPPESVAKPNHPVAEECVSQLAVTTLAAAVGVEEDVDERVCGGAADESAGPAGRKPVPKESAIQTKLTAPKLSFESAPLALAPRMTDAAVSTFDLGDCQIGGQDQSCSSQKTAATQTQQEEVASPSRPPNGLALPESGLVERSQPPGRTDANSLVQSVSACPVRGIAASTQVETSGTLGSPPQGRVGCSFSPRSSWLAATPSLPPSDTPAAGNQRANAHHQQVAPAREEVISSGIMPSNAQMPCCFASNPGDTGSWMPLVSIAPAASPIRGLPGRSVTQAPLGSLHAFPESWPPVRSAGTVYSAAEQNAQLPPPSYVAAEVSGALSGFPKARLTDVKPHERGVGNSGSEEDSSSRLMRAYEVYRQQQLELLRAGGGNV
eukprot:TRINITY_DN49631_c0_g1_i1.p1 TRINITY_DN49631_c0_g1~~TRINITY_DN49631_c0_g1_i1.p1  ORF type:complete len:1162 (+),score=167.46 TRINITY_DN49631_c0_g1_i1:446-3487(+)